VEVDHQRLLLGLCYKSPTSTTETDEKLLAAMEKTVLQIATHQVLIIGDFNFPEIDYASEHVVGRDKESPEMFFNKTQELCLFQHVTDATRIRQNQTPTKLDYVFTDEKNLIEVVKYKVPFGKSDHVVLTWTLLLAIPPVPNNHVKYNYHKGDYQGIQRSLQTIQRKDRWDRITVNVMWVDFREVLKKVVDVYIPLKKEGKRVRNRLSNHVRRKIRERCRAWWKYRQYRFRKKLEKYKQLMNEVNQAIRKEKDQKRKRILAGFKNNPKRFHGYMCSKQTVKDNITTLRKDDGELTRTDQETADLLAAYFKEVYTVEDVINLPVVIEKDLDWQDLDLNFVDTIVMEKLLKLNSDKSPGSDGIHPLLLKKCATVLVEPLSLLFQRSFDTGTLPADWKTANVVPIFKKGDRTDRTNYIIVRSR